MKKSFFALLMILACSATSLFAQSNKGPKIQLKKDVHDYGNIKSGSNGYYEFKFTNTGTAPLLITNAKSSCACLIAQWPKKSINPGDSSSITANYNTKIAGPISKSITVTSNAINEPTLVLRVKGKVVSPPASN
jgi:hypothetical protein